jgi:hypothetical protein
LFEIHADISIFISNEVNTIRNTAQEKLEKQPD